MFVFKILIPDEDLAVKLKREQFEKVKQRLNGAVVKVVTLEVSLVFIVEKLVLKNRF